MTTCLTWSDLDDYFGGLCTTRLKLETPPSNMKTSNCEVCVTPQNVLGVCPACASPPPATYRVVVTYDSGTAGCCSDYNGTFYLYSSGTCQWSSIETEKGVVLSGTFLDEVPVCIPLNNPRSRFVLTATQFFRLGSPRIRWTLSLNYTTNASTYGTICQHTVTARFDTQNNDCTAPALLTRSGGTSGCGFGPVPIYRPYPCRVWNVIADPDPNPNFTATIEPL